MKNIIKVALYESDTKLAPVNDQWKFQPAGRWSCLQKLAWKLLMRTGALETGIEYTTTYQTIQIDGDKALASIMKQRHYAFSQFCRRPTMIYIGPEDMADIMRDVGYCNVKSPINFSGRAGYDYDIYDLPVRIVPHMRGCLVV